MSDTPYNEDGLDEFVKKHTPELLIFSGVSLAAAATVMYNMDPELAQAEVLYRNIFGAMYTVSVLLVGGGIIEGVGDAIKNYHEKKQKP